MCSYNAFLEKRATQQGRSTDSIPGRHHTSTMRRDICAPEGSFRAYTTKKII